MPHRSELPPLTSLHAFHHAAKTLSFKEAAEALNLTPSAVSHRIKALEHSLGTPLFRRQTRALSLTEAGRTYKTTIDNVFSDLAAATAQLKAQPETTVLRLSVLPLFASAILIPRLPKFRKKYPHIDVSLSTESSVANFHTDNIDMGIRNMRVPPTGPGSVKLLDTKPIMLCTQEIAEDINSFGDLKRHTLIHCTPRPNGWRDWLSVQGIDNLQPANDVWVDTIPGGLEAALLGQGVALSMSPLAERTLAGSQLVEPFPTIGQGGTAYFLAHRPEDTALEKIRVFREWILTEMKDFNASAATSHNSLQVAE
ncbi:LysR substrate-binding domain-containing protein [Parvibaculaceae bacterium PLY_AMNH_Bact1]|nr:LysR substrate-binding domain-containing protein [Parvibaculaceae bacterium PLY_AMNH_Bact1]